MNIKDIFVAGGAACAMFFGSGNIVLPLIIGQQYPDIWGVCYLGFILGAVFLPLLGLLAISLRRGSSNKFFEWLGPTGTFLIQLFILGMLGPFGAVPRCFTVAFGGFKAISTSVPGFVFYGVFCLLIWLITSKKDQVMPVISKFLTPIKLAMLIGTVVLCLFCARNLVDPYPTSNALYAFNKSVLYGYQTLDLIGAIYYGSLIVTYAMEKNGQLNQKTLLFFGLKSALVAGILLSVLYLGFIYLAIAYRDITVGVAPDILFITIAESGLGHFTATLVGLTIVISCLTTAVAVISAWTNFLMSYIKGRFDISENTVLVLSLLVTFFISLIGLTGILDMLEPVLMYTYPVIIIITVLNIVKDVKDIYSKKNSGKEQDVHF